MDLTYKVGMRNVKTAISVFICILISKILRLENTFYVAIAAIISMESSITGSFTVGKNRMMGTIVGASVGMVFALIQPNSAILCGLGVIVLITICNMLNWHKSIPIAGIVFMAIMLNLNDKSPVFYSVNRIIDTFIGISVALAVNYLVFPRKYADDMLKMLHALSDKLSRMLDDLLCGDGKTDVSGFIGDVSEAIKQLEIYVSELKIRKKDSEKINHIKKQLELYSDIGEHVKMVHDLAGEAALSPDNVQKLKRISCSDIKIREASKDDLNVVFNYHMGKVLDDVHALQSLRAQV